MSSDASIDWDEARRRLEIMQRKVASGFNPSPEEEKRILKSRARDLAIEPAAATDERDLLRIVEFELAGEHYGLALASVCEVLVLKEITPVPCAPAFIRGIINLRGEIYTIIDLKQFFDLPAAAITELNKVLILAAEDDMRVGILADAIFGVRAISRAALQPSLPTLTGIRANYLHGVTNERLIVLEAANILSDARILVHDEANA